MKSLRELCTRGLWIQQGRLVDDGPIDDVIDRYLAATRRRQRRPRAESKPPPAIAPRSVRHVRLIADHFDGPSSPSARPESSAESFQSPRSDRR